MIENKLLILTSNISNNFAGIYVNSFDYKYFSEIYCIDIFVTITSNISDFGITISIQELNFKIYLFFV